MKLCDARLPVLDDEPAAIHAPRLRSRLRLRPLLGGGRPRGAASHGGADGDWSRLDDAQLAACVRRAADALLVCDEDGVIQLANDAAVALLGKAADALLGTLLSDSLPAAPALLPQALRAPVRLSLATRGGERLLEASATPVAADDRPLIQWRLRELGGRPAIGTPPALDEAARARMLGVIAHELSTPLNAVLGFAQLLRMDSGLDAQRAQWLDRIQDSGRVMQGLIDDLLEFARGDGGGGLGVRLEAVPPRDAVTDALAAAAPQAAWAGVTLHGPAPGALPLVRADERRLRQCLANLLSNAIKYNRRGGQVSVTLDQPGPGELRIAVSDNGLGMDARQIADLFQPFNRLGRECSGHPGTGLGLVITRQLVLAMGGQLDVSAAPGEGSRFTITLQCAPAPTP